MSWIGWVNDLNMFFLHFIESRLSRVSGERKVVPREEMYDRTSR